MKKILIILFLSIAVNATCIQMLKKGSKINGKIFVSYCNNYQVWIRLEDITSTSNGFSITLSKDKFRNFDKALHKTLYWYDIAKKHNVNISKTAYQYKNIQIHFFSSKKGKNASVLIIGANAKQGGSFFILNKNDLSLFIKQIDYILKNGEKEFKKQTELFK